MNIWKPLKIIQFCTFSSFFDICYDNLNNKENFHEILNRLFHEILITHDFHPIISLSTLIFNWKLVAYVKMLPECICWLDLTQYIYIQKKKCFFFIKYNKKKKKENSVACHAYLTDRLFNFDIFWYFFFLFMWCNLMYLRNETIRYSIVAYYNNSK